MGTPVGLAGDKWPLNVLRYHDTGVSPHLDLRHLDNRIRRPTVRLHAAAWLMRTKIGTSQIPWRLFRCSEPYSFLLGGVATRCSKVTRHRSRWSIAGWGISYLHHRSNPHPWDLSPTVYHRSYLMGAYLMWLVFLTKQPMLCSWGEALCAFPHEVQVWLRRYVKAVEEDNPMWWGLLTNNLEPWDVQSIQRETIMIALQFSGGDKALEVGCAVWIWFVFSVLFDVHFDRVHDWCGFCDAKEFLTNNLVVKSSHIIAYQLDMARATTQLFGGA